MHTHTQDVNWDTFEFIWISVTVIALIIRTAKNKYYYDCSALHGKQLNYTRVALEYIYGFAICIWDEHGAILNDDEEGPDVDTEICRGGAAVCNVSFVWATANLSSALPCSLSVTRRCPWHGMDSRVEGVLGNFYSHLSWQFPLAVSSRPQDLFTFG